MSSELKFHTFEHCLQETERVCVVLIAHVSYAWSKQVCDTCSFFFFHFGHNLSHAHDRVNVLCTCRKTGPILISTQQDTWHHLPEKIVCHSSGGIVSHSYINSSIQSWSLSDEQLGFFLSCSNYRCFYRVGGKKEKRKEKMRLIWIQTFCWMGPNSSNNH